MKDKIWENEVDSGVVKGRRPGREGGVVKILSHPCDANSTVNVCTLGVFDVGLVRGGIPVVRLFVIRVAVVTAQSFLCHLKDEAPFGHGSNLDPFGTIITHNVDYNTRITFNFLPKLRV